MNEFGRTQDHYDYLKAEAEKADAVFADEIAQIKAQIVKLEHKLIAKEYEREDLAQDWSLRIGRVAEQEKRSPSPLLEPNITFAGDYYYLRDHDLWYHKSFPLDWALTHLAGTGCIDCVNCAKWGKKNGVVIGYCSNCAEFLYNGDRGSGFKYDGPYVAQANNHYLIGVDLDSIRHPWNLTRA